jgi:hypothetical protein
VNGAGARRKGISYQHDVAVWLEANVGPVIKPVQELDADDLIVLGHGLSVETKNHQTTQLASFVDQAVRQAAKRGLLPVVVHKRVRKGDVGEHYVTMRAADFAALLGKLGGGS